MTDADKEVTRLTHEVTVLIRDLIRERANAVLNTHKYTSAPRKTGRPPPAPRRRR